MIISGYCISGYWWILVVFNVIILVGIGCYFINGYWWLLYYKPLVVIDGY
jgi:hypothetical protein